MDKKAKVGPDLMDIIYAIILDHHFHTHLTPCRYSYYIPNVPFFCVLYNFIEFLVPVFDSCNVTARFIKTLKPERTLFCQDTTEVAGVPSGFAFLEICCSPDHQKPLRH